MTNYNQFLPVHSSCRDRYLFTKCLRCCIYQLTTMCRVFYRVSRAHTHTHIGQKHAAAVAAAAVLKMKTIFRSYA